MLYEIAHLLILQHPFEANDGDVYGDVNTTNAEDTVMAYGTNTGTYPLWYQDIDIQALQIIYGEEQPRIFESNFRDYNFYKIDNGYGIKLKEGANAIDEITGIENLKFNDKQTNLISDIKGVFDQVTGLNTDSGKMFRLYNAAFARFPDADGLRYWINNFSSGIDDERAVSSSFIISAEFKQLYGDNITHETYVQNLYMNVLIDS